MATLATESFYIARIYKRAVGNPDYSWVNTYEVEMIDPLPGSSDWDDLLGAFVEFEKAIHVETVQFTRATLSTWVPDESPYNPASFYVKELSEEFGEKQLDNTEALPRHLALLVKRGVESGRSGRLFYRGALTEDDMETGSSFDPQLTSASALAITTAIAGALTALNAQFEALGGAGSGLRLIRLTSSETVEARVVTTLVARGIAANSPDHRYYDIA